MKLTAAAARRWAMLLVLLIGTAFGCDDSSEGSDSSDSGSVRTDISPDRISVGSLAFVNVDFSRADFDDIDSQGLTVKVLAPAELAYQVGSSTLTLRNGAKPIAPFAVTPAPAVLVNNLIAESGVRSNDGTSSSGEFIFYIFPLSADTLDEEADGTLQATFEVRSVPAQSVIFTDVDRGAVTSFDAANSDFDGEVVSEFRVADDDEEVSE